MTSSKHHFLNCNISRKRKYAGDSKKKQFLFSLGKDLDGGTDLLGLVTIFKSYFRWAHIYWLVTLVKQN